MLENPCAKRTNMSCDMTIQDKKVTFHYIFLQFYTNCFTHQTKKVVHYSSEKSNKCKEFIFPIITSFGVCKHYCTLCNNSLPQPPNYDIICLNLLKQN
jgi:hypothetical protein